MCIFTNISKLCIKNNITIAELERRLNFSKATISKWKTSSPSINKIIMVADYFDVSIDSLVKSKNTYEVPEKFYDNPELLFIQKAYYSMSDADREKFKKLMQIVFENLFE